MTRLAPSRPPQGSAFSAGKEIGFARLVSWVLWTTRAGLWTLIGCIALSCPGALVSSAYGDTPPPLADSEYLVRAWETEDGLPENSATSIVQTQDGYLWFGTFNGLVRYNGDQFTVLSPDNTPELPSAGIVNLHLDKHDRLWVSTYQGLVLRDGAHWRPLRQPDGTPLSVVRTFSERANGDVLITTFDGRIYESSGADLAALPSPPGTQGEGWLGGVDEEGHWWVLQHLFVGRWETNRWVRMLPPLDVPDETLGCAPARDGGLWLLLGKELRKVRRGAVVARIALPENPGGVWSLCEDSQGNVWFSSFNQGFSRIGPGGDMKRWRAADGASDQGRCVFEDRERNLWLGTSGDGLLRLTHRRFRHFQLSSKSKGVLVHSVSADNTGGVWAATFGQGLFHLNEAGVTTLLPPALSNSSTFLQSVLVDRAGRLFVSGMGVGLWAYDQTGTRRVGSEENVVALFEDSKKQVWFSSAGGLATRLDANRIQEFGYSNGLPKDAATCFAEDGSGAIWIAGSSGVFRRSGEGSFTEVKDSAGAALGGVLCLKADREGAVWLGSSDRGLLRCKDGAVAVLDADDGFPVTSVGGMVEDGLGFWWMTSGPRLVRARLQDLQAVADRRKPRVDCQVFDVSDGLPRAEFNSGRQPTNTRDSHGRLWFAMTKGVAMVDPAALRLNDRPPPVYVEEISFSPSASLASKPSRQLTRSWGAPLPGPVVLPPGSRGIEIRYTALSLAASEKVRFQVKLEGANAAWQDVEQRRTAFYHELPPARYVFRVRAANNDGVWNESGTSLTFTVLPFFWQTWWFRLGTTLLLIALGGALVWAWSHQRVVRALERERLVVEMQQLRDELAHSSRVSTMGQLASALAHELGQPLGAILRNTEAAELIIEQEPLDLAEIRAILTDIRLDDQRAAGVIQGMRALLKRRNVEWAPLSLGGLVADVAALVRPDALQRKVQLAIHVPVGIPPVYGDRVQLQQVLLNLLLNGMDAMSQQPPQTRRLTVQARTIEAQMVEVAVRDSGPGVPAQSVARVFEPFYSTKPQGMGLGLAVSKTIIEAHKGRIWAENRLEGGASFCFTVPFAASVPTDEDGGNATRSASGA